MYLRDIGDAMIACLLFNKDPDRSTSAPAKCAIWLRYIPSCFIEKDFPISCLRQRKRK
jgi:hypothetical protein